MKILYYDFILAHLISDASYPVGGATIETYAWINGLRTIGIDVGVLTWKGTKKYIKKDYNFEFVESYKLKKGIPVLRTFYYYIPSLYKSIKRYNPDFIIQEVSGRDTGIIAIISKLLKIKFIHRIASDRDVDERLKKLNINKIDYILYNLGLKLSDFLCCQNSYQKYALDKRFPSKRIFTLYNPFIYYDHKILPFNKRYYIAWVGNHRPVKNMSALLNVVKALPEIQFKIAGKTLVKFLDEDTKNAIDELKKLKNVEFTGYLKQEEILFLLKQAYLLLNTSLFEGFSCTFLEAWSVGTPVITTRNANPDNIINIYKLGFAVNDYKEIPEKIKLIVNSTNFSEMTKRCQNYVRTNHESKMLAKKLISFIKF